MALLDFKNEKFDIIVLAGQSNAEGWGFGEATEQYLPDDRILWANDTLNACFKKDENGVDYLDMQYPTPIEISVADEPSNEKGKIGKFSLFFAKEYIKDGKLAEDRKILILNCAVGGTGFRDDQWGTERTLYKRLKEFTKLALGLNPENQLKVFLWHQGECDSLANCELSFEEKKAIHKNNLDSIFNDYLAEFNCKDLPIISGAFCDEWYLKNVEACNPVLDAIRDFCKEHGSFVDTSGLKSNNLSNGDGDDIHFSRESTRPLGRRFYQAYKEIVK